MGILNPYQPPSVSVPSIESDSLEGDGLETRLLPRSFWFVWAGFVSICAVFLTLILFQVAVDRDAESWIGLPLSGLFLAPFVVVRAKWCERYQHRCVGSNGLVIFLACLGVCFGLGYASILIAFVFWTLLFLMIGNSFQSSSSLRSALLAAGVLMALFVYLGLIHLSAQRPKLKKEVGSS